MMADAVAPRRSLAYFHRTRAGAPPARENALASAVSEATRRLNLHRSDSAVSSVQGANDESIAAVESAPILSRRSASVDTKASGHRAVMPSPSERGADVRMQALARMQNNAAKEDGAQRLANAERTMRQLETSLQQASKERDEAREELSRRRSTAAELASVTATLESVQETNRRLEKRLILVERELEHEHALRVKLAGELDASEASSQTSASRVAELETALRAAVARADAAEAELADRTSELHTIRRDHDGRRALLRDLLLTVEAKERQLDVFTAAAAHIEARARGEQETTPGISENASRAFKAVVARTTTTSQADAVTSRPDGDPPVRHAFDTTPANVVDIVATLTDRDERLKRRRNAPLCELTAHEHGADVPVEVALEF